MNFSKLKEIANVLAPKQETTNETVVTPEGSRHLVFLAIMILGMGLSYIYNDVDYDLQIKHYSKTREALIDRRYTYISDQQELNRAGMRSNVEAKLSQRGSRIMAPKTKPILINYEED